MTNKKFRKLLIILLFVSTFIPLQSQARLVPCGYSGGPTCNLCHVFELINNILSLILTRLVPVVAGLMIVVGGLVLLTAGASPERVSQAKIILTATVVGMVVVFGAWILLNTILVEIGVADWTKLEGDWWQIECNVP